MNAFFADCANLKNINLSSFDTSSVTDMTGMFTNKKRNRKQDANKNKAI